MRPGFPRRPGRARAAAGRTRPAAPTGPRAGRTCRAPGSGRGGRRAEVDGSGVRQGSHRGRAGTRSAGGRSPRWRCRRLRSRGCGRYSPARTARVGTESVEPSAYRSTAGRIMGSVSDALPLRLVCESPPCARMSSAMASAGCCRVAAAARGGHGPPGPSAARPCAGQRGQRADDTCGGRPAAHNRRVHPAHRTAPAPGRAAGTGSGTGPEPGTAPWDPSGTGSGSGRPPTGPSANWVAASRR